MAPTLIIIRHAEALHNYTIHDPPLTSLGLTQCTTLSTALQSHPLAPKISLIVVSPLLRALQTASALTFLTTPPVSVPIIALAELQENTVNNIDIGRPIPELQTSFPAIDFSHMDPIFPAKEGIYAFSQEALTARGRKVRKWLRERKEEVVVVVGHDGFLRVGVCHRKFGNADFRILEFENEGEGRDGLGLVEWKETEEKGGELGLSPKGVFGWLPNDFKYMPEKPVASSDGVSEKHS